MLQCLKLIILLIFTNSTTKLRIDEIQQILTTKNTQEPPHSTFALTHSLTPVTFPYLDRIELNSEISNLSSLNRVEPRP